MIASVLRRLDAINPWIRQPPVINEVFDPRREQSCIAETVMRAAAGLLHTAGAEQGPLISKVHVFCDALVAATPHLRLSWTWFGLPDTRLIVPEIVSGPAASYARRLRIPRSMLTDTGPAYRALRGERAVPYNVSEASLYPPWRELAQKHGVRSVVALSLAAPDDERRGVFVLYADVPDYFAEVGIGLFDAIGGLISAALAQSTRYERMREAACVDPLTSLDTRAHALAQIKGAWMRQATAPMSLILLDLDRFKDVNDTYGHSVGDEVLRACSMRMRTALRRSDGMGRWGGEEFLAWLPDTTLADACVVAEKLRMAVKGEPLALPSGIALDLTVSMGVVQMREHEHVHDAIARADDALYVAKRDGRDRIVPGD